jgi:iron complex transport system substrate-binding protein
MRPLPTIAGALAALTLVTVATGCGLRSEPTGAIPPAPVTVTDSTGHDVSVATQPQRIVSLDAGATELLFDVGAGAKVVGRSSGTALPAAATKVKVVSANRPAAIRALHPDLVIVPAGDAGSLGSVLKGVPLYASADGSISAAERDMVNVGLLAGYGPKARAVADQTGQTIRRITRQMSVHPAQKTYLDQGYVYAPPAMATQLITAAGGSPVKVTSQAALRKAAPDVYLIQQGAEVTPKEVEHDPATRNLPAVKAKRVHVVPLWWVTTDGPSMAEAVKHLAQLIHPGARAGQ